MSGQDETHSIRGPGRLADVMQAEFCQLLGQLVAGPGQHARVQQSCAGAK